MPEKGFRSKVFLRFKYFREKLPLSQKYVTSEGVVSHNVLNYHQLFVAHYQVSFYANIYFESLPNVSSAFEELFGIGPLQYKINFV